MAIDARIALAGQPVNVAPAINIFENALMNAQTRGLRQAQEQRAQQLAPFKLQQAQQGVDLGQQRLTQGQQAISAGEAAAQEQEENRVLRSVAEFGTKLKPVLESGDNLQALVMLDQRLGELESQGLPTQETQEAIAQIQGGNPQGVVDGINSIQQIAQQRGLGVKGQRQFAAQQSAPITDPVTGQVSTPVFDPNTQTTTLVPIKGAIQQTPTQKAEAALDVETAQRKETIKTTVARTSALKKEFSERRRLAARSTRKVKEAQKLAQNATQGVTGTGKLALSRLFPGIDANDEGALSSAFKSLAFEFAVTEDIAGSLGNSASANLARLSSLERANWFMDRESQQFNDHIKGGHDPDEFFFNFAELVTPKKGGKSYSLQSLQDTAVANHISIDEVIKRLSR